MPSHKLHRPLTHNYRSRPDPRTPRSHRAPTADREHQSTTDTCSRSPSAAGHLLSKQCGVAKRGADSPRPGVEYQRSDRLVTVRKLLSQSALDPNHCPHRLVVIIAGAAVAHYCSSHMHVDYCPVSTLMLFKLSLFSLVRAVAT